MFFFFYFFHKSLLIFIARQKKTTLCPVYLGQTATVVLVKVAPHKGAEHLHHLQVADLALPLAALRLLLHAAAVGIVGPILVHAQVGLTRPIRWLQVKDAAKVAHGGGLQEVFAWKKENNRKLIGGIRTKKEEDKQESDLWLLIQEFWFL